MIYDIIFFMRKKSIFANLSLLFCAIIGLGIIFYHHMKRFIYANYLNENPDLTTVGPNVVSPWADFTFFTYITVIIFSFWCIGYCLSNIFSLQKLNNFLRKDSIICFIFCNYILTFSLYTFFQVFDHFTFGWYGNSPLSWHSLGTSITLHYIFFAIECVIFAKIETISSNHKKRHIYSSIFLITYYATVKIIGECAFKVHYFPYIIFDAEAFGNTIGISSYKWSVILLVLFCCILFLAYQVTLYSLLKFKTGQQEKFSITM